MDSQTLELLTGSPDNGLGSSFGNLMVFITIASVIATILILVMWVMSQMHRRKVQNAIIEIRDILQEMNERDKQRLAPRPAAPVTPPVPTETTLAE